MNELNARQLQKLLASWEESGLFVSEEFRALIDDALRGQLRVSALIHLLRTTTRVGVDYRLLAHVAPAFGMMIPDHEKEELLAFLAYVLLEGLQWQYQQWRYQQQIVDAFLAIAERYQDPSKAWNVCVMASQIQRENPGNQALLDRVRALIERTAPEINLRGGT